MLPQHRHPCGSGQKCVCCLAYTPVRLAALRPLLAIYPNRVAAEALHTGFTEGFRLGFRGARGGSRSENPKSIRARSALALEKLTKEVHLGRMAGPFISSPIPNLKISPIGLVPKSEPGSFRLIHNLSYPSTTSVNEGIDKQYCSVRYSSFDDAIQLVVRAGKGAFLAKADVKSAFRLLPVHPSDFCLLGIELENKIFIDKALPMGASCAPALFESFSTFLEWALRFRTGSDMVCHYADDFLFVGRAKVGGHVACDRLLQSFGDLCAELGVPLAEEKTVFPSTVLTFLGLEIDTVALTVSVPAGKLSEIRLKTQAAVRSKKLTLRSLQSLIGSLSFICRAVAPGRAFLRRLIDLLSGCNKPWHKIRLSRGAKADLQMWLVFLEKFNGKAIISDQFWVQDSDIQLFTDASGGIGFGGYFGGRWFSGPWPAAVLSASHSIAWLEFFPVVVALTLWGSFLAGKRVLIRSDNTAVVSIINKQTSKCNKIMRLVRYFVLLCLEENVSFRAKYIPGVRNNIADALSRLQMSRFRELAPSASTQGCAVPGFLWEL